MEINTILWFVLILICLYFFKAIVQENFEIVGFNDNTIPDYKIKNIYDTETEKLTSILKSLFKDNDMTKTGYTIYGKYLDFPFANVIKHMIADFLKTNVSIFAKDKLEVNSNINDLYWKDVGNDRLFIFNVNLLNNTHFLTRTINVKIMIQNIKSFLNGENYRTDVPSATLTNSIKILSIMLGTSNYIKDFIGFSGVDTLEPVQYNIENTLHLMDPFITSGNQMVITPTMMSRFSVTLDDHRKLLQQLSK